MSTQLRGSKALWNRWSLDLRSDEQLAQLMDRGSLADWAILRDLAMSDPTLRRRMLWVIERVEIGFPGFWLATLSGLGELVDWSKPLPTNQGI